MLKPIPRALLLHRATLHDVQKDAWNEPKVVKSTELARVRVELDASQEETGQGMEHKRAALLFFDLKNSAPAGVTFQPGQLLDFGGHRFEVYGAELVEGFGPHHWEVVLR